MYLFLSIFHGLNIMSDKYVELKKVQNIFVLHQRLNFELILQLCSRCINSKFMFRILLCLIFILFYNILKTTTISLSDIFNEISIILHLLTYFNYLSLLQGRIKELKWRMQPSGGAVSTCREYLLKNLSSIFKYLQINFPKHCQ